MVLRWRRNYLKYYNDEPTSIEIEEIFNTFLDYNLSYNYPNPFNPTTKINYTIPALLSPPLGKGEDEGAVRYIKVYDLLGREVATLVNEEKPAGEYEVEFNAANLPSGIYFYQLKAGDLFETKKMVLMPTVETTEDSCC